ncbi:MAG: TolC family protein [Mariprofundaceae bacterium]
MIAFRSFFTLFASLIAITPALAVEKASLSQCVAWSIERSPDMEEAEANIRQAAALLEQVNGKRYISGSLFAIVAPTATAKGQPLNAEPGYSSAKLHGITDWEWGTLQLTLPLYTFGKIDSYERAAGANIKLHEARREKQKLNVAMLTTEAYQGYLLAHTGMRLAKSIDKIVVKAIAQTEQMLEEESDEVSETDLLKLKSGRGQVLQIYHEAKAGKRFTESALKLLTGHAVIPKERKLTALKLPDLSLQEWITLGKSERPEFREATSGLEARGALLAAEEANALPDIFMFAMMSAAHSSGRDRIIDPFIRDDFNHALGTIGLGMRWEFDPMVHRAKLAGRQAEVDQVRAKQRFANEMIPLQIEKDYREFMGLKDQVAALKQSAQAGRQWLISAATSYDMGIGEAKDIFEALSAYAQAEGAKLKALHKHNMTGIQLLHHVGKIDAASVVP